MSSPLDVLLGTQVKDNGVAVTPRRYLDLRTGLTVTDDPATDSIRVSATGGGGGVLVGDVNGDADANVVTQITGDTGDVSMLATSLSWGAPGSSQLKVNGVDGAIELWNDAVRALKAHSSAMVVANTTSVTQIQGGVQNQIRTISSNITLDSTTKDFIGWVDASVPRIITLPTPSAGRVFTLVNVGASSVTLARHAAELINGVAASYVVPVTNCIVEIVSNGTDWFALPVYDGTAAGYLKQGGDLLGTGGTALAPRVSGLTGITGVVAMHGTQILADAGAGGRIDFAAGGVSVPAGTFTAGSGTAKAVIGSYAFAPTTHSALWVGAITPDNSNPAVAGDGTTNTFNAITKVQIGASATVNANFTSAGLRIGDASSATVKLDVVGAGKFTTDIDTNTAGVLCRLGGLVGAVGSYGALYLGTAVPAGNNYTTICNGSTDLRFNSPNAGGKVQIENGGTAAMNVTSTGVRIGDATTATAKLDVQGSALLGTTTSAHQFIGSQRWTTRSTSSSFTIDTTTTDCIVLMDVSGAARTVTLPAPTNGRIIKIKDKTGSAGTNNITIARNGSEQIEGVAASYVMATNWGCITLVSDGTNWFIC